MSPRLKNSLNNLLISVDACLATLILTNNYLSPNYLFFHLISYATPVLLSIMFIDTLYLLIILKKRVILGCLLIITCIEPIRQTYPFSKEPNNQANKPRFSVMNWNVGTFSPAKFGQSDEQAARINTALAWLRRQTTLPDIFCIQEFFHHDEVSSTRTIETIMTIGDYQYAYATPRNFEYAKGIYGLITFSRFPVLKSGLVFQEEGASLNGCIFSDILFNGDTIRIYNVHLNSMNIRWQADQTICINIDSIVSRLMRGQEARSNQTELLLNHQSLSPYPAIICGDFNTTPYEKIYKSFLKKGLSNSFETTNLGYHWFSYHRFPFWVRIDHQFYSTPLQSFRHQIMGDVSVSDHYPIWSEYWRH